MEHIAVIYHEKNCESFRTIINAMKRAHQLEILFSNTKAKSAFMRIQENVVECFDNIGKIKQLCLTIWLCRRSQIKDILNSYEVVIKKLTEQGYGDASVYLVYLRIERHIQY